MNETISKNQIFLAKSVLNIFNESIEDMRNVTLLSQLNNSLTLNEERNISQDIKEAHELFLNINEKSSTEDCERFLNFVKTLSREKKNFMNTVSEPCSDVFDYLKCLEHLRELLIKQLHETQNSWLDVKQETETYPDEIKKLLEQLEEIQLIIKSENVNRNQSEMKNDTKKETKERIRNEIDDFTSHHASCLIANAEEKIKFIEKINEEKILQMKERQAVAEEKLLESMLKYRTEIKTVIKETLNTRDFIEWVKKEHKAQLEKYEEEQNSLWEDFSSEMEECRSVCQRCRDLEETYKKMMGEKEMKEFEKKLVSAAITLQAHWRGYLVRKRLAEKDGPTDY